jgi:hypothetical protein
MHSWRSASRTGARSRTTTDDTARLALECAGHQAADVVALERDVHDDARNHGDHCAGQQQSVVDGAVGARLRVAQRDRRRLLYFSGT